MCRTCTPRRAGAGARFKRAQGPRPECRLDLLDLVGRKRIAAGGVLRVPETARNAGIDGRVDCARREIAARHPVGHDERLDDAGEDVGGGREIDFADRLDLREIARIMLRRLVGHDAVVGDEQPVMDDIGRTIAPGREAGPAAYRAGDRSAIGVDRAGTDRFGAEPRRHRRWQVIGQRIPRERVIDELVLGDPEDHQPAGDLAGLGDIDRRDAAGEERGEQSQRTEGSESKDPRHERRQCRDRR